MARAPSPEPPVTAPALRGCVSAHGQSGSSVAASPVRASPAGLSRRPAYAGARARRHRLRGTCWVPRCPPAPPPRLDRRARPPEPTHDCRLRTHRPGVEQCGERETPRSQPREQRGGSEHRARARRRRQSLGARARGGGGAHVRVFVSGSRRTRGPLAQGSLPLRICAGPRASDRGSLSISALLLPCLHPHHAPVPLLLLKPTGRKS